MNATLATRIMPMQNAMLRNAVLAIAGSLLVAIAAQVRIPFWPVPMTLQPLAVLLVGGAFGARLGASTMGLYAIEGFVGLPVFSGLRAGLFDGKLDYLFPAPSTGYILGYILAAALIGYLAECGWIASAPRMVLAALIGAAVLYVPGLLWLATWYIVTQGLSTDVAVSSAIAKGLVPFIPGDIVKAVIAGLGLAGGWSLVKR